MTARTSWVELDDAELEVFENETEMFVADTLDAVREVTTMNEAYVLPMAALPVARPIKPPMPAVSPRHKVVILEKADVESSLALAAMPTPIDPILLQPRPSPRAPRRPARAWPVYLCAFIASVCAGAAIMQSPAGPRLRHAYTAFTSELARSL